MNQTFYLMILHSSVGPDDDANRRNPHQAWQSNATRSAFIQALQTADIVFYNGHSRSGGGPDFEPPRLDSSNHTDYAWYRKQQPGLKLLADTLAGHPESPLRCLGLFSCASEQLFAERITKANRGVKLLSSSKLLYFSDALGESLAALSEALSGSPSGH